MGSRGIVAAVLGGTGHGAGCGRSGSCGQFGRTIGTCSSETEVESRRFHGFLTVSVEDSETNGLDTRETAGGDVQVTEK